MFFIYKFARLEVGLLLQPVGELVHHLHDVAARSQLDERHRGVPLQHLVESDHVVVVAEEDGEDPDPRAAHRVEHPHRRVTELLGVETGRVDRHPVRDDH